MIYLNKIRTKDAVVREAAERRSPGRRIGLTNGCFDIIHAGHVRYLCQARERCDILIVAVNSDSSVRLLKGADRPINGQQARMEVLAGLECVDVVTLFEEKTPAELIKAVTPDVLFKGGDWHKDEIAGGAHVEAQGGEIDIIPFCQGYSTTSVIERIRRSGNANNGDIDG